MHKDNKENFPNLNNIFSMGSTYLTAFRERNKKIDDISDIDNYLGSDDESSLDDDLPNDSENVLESDDDEFDIEGLTESDDEVSDTESQPESDDEASDTESQPESDNEASDTESQSESDDSEATDDEDLPEIDDSEATDAEDTLECGDDVSDNESLSDNDDEANYHFATDEILSDEDDLFAESEPLNILDYPEVEYDSNIHQTDKPIVTNKIHKNWISVAVLMLVCIFSISVINICVSNGDITSYKSKNEVQTTASTKASTTSSTTQSQNDASTTQSSETSSTTVATVNTTQAPITTQHYYETLQEGCKGDAVKKMQLRLSELGYLGKESCTGYYGSFTKGIVMFFQKKAGLNQTGIADNETLTKLYSDDAPYCR